MCQLSAILSTRTPRRAIRRAGAFVLAVALVIQQGTTRAGHVCEASLSDSATASAPSMQHHMDPSRQLSPAPADDHNRTGEQPTMPGLCTSCASAPIAIVMRALAEVAPEQRAFDAPSALVTRIDVAPDVPPPRN